MPPALGKTVVNGKDLPVDLERDEDEVLTDHFSLVRFRAAVRLFHGFYFVVRFYPRLIQDRFPLRIVPRSTQGI